MALLSETIAQQIVLEMEKIIERNINIMNETGVIIASKDTERIGNFHEGALKVIQEGEPVPIYSDLSHQGSKAGMNMPIFFKGALIGVIGITGDPDEISDYAKIIHKMTEVMVKEAYVSQELELEKSVRERFVHEWMRRQWSNRSDFLLRAKTLQIEMATSRQVLLFELVHLKEKQDSELARQERLRSIMKEVGDMLGIGPHDILVLWQSNQFVLLKQEPSASYPSQVKECLRRLCNNQIGIHCGIGRQQHDMDGAVKSFEEAQQALFFARQKQQSVVAFNDLGIESIVYQIPEAVKNDFVERFFPVFHDTKHRQLVESVKVFLEHGQSIASASDALFIHKNTLQYRLKKMEQLTGFDPRKFQDAALYWLALAFLEKQ
ncbi:CdaR family transcriptional regulator [Sediminibacillus halophilus]|uniref:Carbohydrate diacid regulator n=1 Tax=Sediminibacillus halophilus TaxID=482461 RepID=A0A1G9W3S7_9BACI|nr:sugar diacid recognition domain-containing protein [Sediminibacillus halophilus]SDM79179.1 carbohydrate diacid regulator [Sediminibacillus halophilus]